MVGRHHWRNTQSTGWGDRHRSAGRIESAVGGSVFLPNAHAVCNPVVKARWAYGGLNTGGPEPLANAIADAGEGYAHPVAPQVLHEYQQGIARAGVDEIDRLRVQQNMPHRWMTGGQRGL